VLFLPFIGYSNYRVYTQLGVNMYSLLILVTAVSTAGLAGGRRLVRSIEGPTVDPGVFVITHIRSCRNGAGYCILGIDCTVDTDFVKDDSGGDCNSLGTAFSPQAKFVCCKVNPANFEVPATQNLDAVVLEQNSVAPSTTTTTTTTTPTPTTSIVTEIVTEIQTQTELFTKVEAMTEVYTEIVTELVTQYNTTDTNTSESEMAETSTSQDTESTSAPNNETMKQDPETSG